MEDCCFARPETGGFGLFSIKERCDMLGGSMNMRAAPVGTCPITLQCAADAPDGASHPVQGETKDAPAEPAGREPGGNPKESRSAEAEAGRIRVLLVDDHRIVREGLAGILRGEPDIELVAEASDGQEAVERTERTEPDVVVMDVSMPRMDGTEATRIIRRDHPEIRVIGLSMHDREDLAQAMHEAGASAYLTKGGPASELIETIREQVREQPTG